MRPVRARPSASVEYSYTSMSHKYFISFSRAVLTARGSNGPPLTSSSCSQLRFAGGGGSSGGGAGGGAGGRCERLLPSPSGRYLLR